MQQSLAQFFHNRERSLLLHCCCAPCSCSIIEKLLLEGIALKIFFYNPNIYPEEEYLRRKSEIIQYAQKKGVFCVDVTYDPERWIAYVQGHENDPERGERCSLCFEFRLATTAAYAAEHGFSVIGTTLGISRWKNFEQVVQAGRRAVSQFPGIMFLDYNWRKNGGSARMDELTAQEGMYRQSYCGCRYSSPSLQVMNGP